MHTVSGLPYRRIHNVKEIGLFHTNVNKCTCLIVWVFEIVSNYSSQSVNKLTVKIR